MEKVLMKGNEALAEAAIMSGCRYFFGYPITPQTEVSAYMAKRLPKVGGVFLQAESEVSAINMVFGAAGAGARVLTSSSSPGISLKAEGMSSISGADLPCVVINMVRGGPGLGGIQPAQSDYFQATKGHGHGDYHTIVLAPASVQESMDLMAKAFNLADKYRMIAMIMGDGSLGQMMEPVSLELNEKVETIDKSGWATVGTEGKRDPHVINSLYIVPDELEQLLKDRYKKYDYIKEHEAMFEAVNTEDADLIVVAYGITSRVAKTAISMARAKGLKVGLIRPITLWPFPVKAFAETVDKVKSYLCVEMSMGQMIEDVKLATECKKPVHLYTRNGGNVPTPAEVLAQIEKILGGGK